MAPFFSEALALESRPGRPFFVQVLIFECPNGQGRENRHRKPLFSHNKWIQMVFSSNFSLKSIQGPLCQKMLRQMHGPLIWLPQTGWLVLWQKKQVPDWNPGASLLQVCIAVCHYCWLLSNGNRLSSCPIVLVRCCCLHKKRINGRLHDMAMLDRLLQSSVPLQRLASTPVELKQCADNWVRHRLEMPNFDICHVFPKTLPLQLYFCVLDIRWRSSQIVGKSYGHRRTLQFRVVGRWTVIIIRITERESFCCYDPITLAI